MSLWALFSSCTALPSLSMINRETLVPGAASRDRRSSPLAGSNESHLLVGLAPSEPLLLPDHLLLSSHLLRPSISRPSTALALPLLHLFLAFRLSTYRKGTGLVFLFCPCLCPLGKLGFACHPCPPRPHPQLTRVRCSLNSCAVNNRIRGALQALLCSLKSACLSTGDCWTPDCFLLMSSGAFGVECSHQKASERI